VHRLGKQQAAQFFSQRRTAGFAGDDNFMTALAQPVCKPFQVGALAGTIDTLQGNELGANDVSPYFDRWY
jgi:hypothetical protein